MDDMQNLGYLLAAACRKYGDAIAIDAAESKLTYEALLDEAIVVQRALNERTCEANEPVHVLVSNHPSDLAGFLGVWLAGGVAVPIHRTSPAGVIDAIHHRTRARLVVDVAQGAAPGSNPVAQISD